MLKIAISVGITCFNPLNADYLQGSILNILSNQAHGH